MAKKPPPKPAAKPATGRQRDPAKLWGERLTRANKTYDKWATTFDVEHLEAYYEGRHWRGLADTDRQQKYTINLIFATTETQLPSLMFSRPRVTVDSRPDHQLTANSDASGRATLVEQTLQTQIDDPKLHFGFLTTLALRDAYPGFGVVEVGYSADWIDNPNAGKPVLKENDEPMMDREGAKVLQGRKVLKPGTKEALFLKQIPFDTCRVSPGRNLLAHNDWFAYYEWHYVEDVKANKDYENTADLAPTGQIATQDETTDDPDHQLHTGMVKIWKIWDFRQKVRHVSADGHSKLLQYNKPYTYCPIAVLKFFERRKAFYPLPPVFNWLSPQDEKNEIREMQRVHRRRAARRYMREPSVDQTEFEKLETGDDMVCIQVPKVNPSPIMPIPDAPLDSQFSTVMAAATQDDFTQITGVSGEARGAPEADTATQANIINVRAQVRESRARLQVAEWLGDIIRLMLLTMREKMQQPFMVKQSVDPFTFASSPTRVKRVANEWKEITSQDIADLDVDIKIDIASLSPVAEDAQRAAWNVVLQLLTNQALAALLFMPQPEAPDEPSPMLRKTLALNGVKSDAEVREIWRIGQAVMAQAAKAAQAQASAGNPPVQPSISLALKGEDMRDPVIGPLITLMFERAEQLRIQSLPEVGAVPPPNSNGGGGGLAPLVKAAPGPITGSPAPAPAMGG